MPLYRGNEGDRCHFLFVDRFGRVEGVKLLPQKHPNIGLAAFVDFEDAKSAHAAQSATIKIKVGSRGEREKGVSSSDLCGSCG